MLSVALVPFSRPDDAPDGRLALPTRAKVRLLRRELRRRLAADAPRLLRALNRVPSWDRFEQVQAEKQKRESRWLARLLRALWLDPGDVYAMLELFAARERRAQRRPGRRQQEPPAFWDAMAFALLQRHVV